MYIFSQMRLPMHHDMPPSTKPCVPWRLRLGRYPGRWEFMLSDEQKKSRQSRTIPGPWSGGPLALTR